MENLNSLSYEIKRSSEYFEATNVSFFIDGKKIELEEYLFSEADIIDLIDSFDGNAKPGGKKINAIIIGHCDGCNRWQCECMYAEVIENDSETVTWVLHDTLNEDEVLETYSFNKTEYQKVMEKIETEVRKEYLYRTEYSAITYELCEAKKTHKELKESIHKYETEIKEKILKELEPYGVIYSDSSDFNIKGNDKKAGYTVTFENGRDFNLQLCYYYYRDYTDDGFILRINDFEIYYDRKETEQIISEFRNIFTNKRCILEAVLDQRFHVAFLTEAQYKKELHMTQVPNKIKLHMNKRELKQFRKEHGQIKVIYWDPDLSFTYNV